MFVTTSTLNKKLAHERESWSRRYSDMDYFFNSRNRDQERKIDALEEHIIMLLNYLKLEVHSPDPKPYLKDIK